MAYSDLASQTPYLDDFIDAIDETTKNYLRILFYPGRAVQARELTQAQTILQNQLGRFANHIFENGSNVLGAKLNVDNEKPYIELDPEYPTGTPIDIKLFTGLVDTTTPITSGAKEALVTHVDEPNRRVYISYLNGEFSEGDVVNIGAGDQGATVATGGTRKSTWAHIDDGIVYYDSMFVVVSSATIIVDATGTGGSYKIGLNITDSIASAENGANDLREQWDEAYVVGAPGADRYVVTPTLVSYTAAEIPADTFISMIEYVDGIEVKSQKSVQYSTIMETIARRTFDESGNYSVEEFALKAIPYNGTIPDATKFTISADPGKAYILGYEVETVAPTYVHLDKARTSRSVSNDRILCEYGPYTDIILDEFNVSGVFDISTKEEVELMTAAGGAGTVLGTCRVVAVSQGNAGEARVYFAGIEKFESVFSSVRSIRSKNSPSVWANVKLYEDNNGRPKLYGIETRPLIFPMDNPYIKALTLDSSTYEVIKSEKIPVSGNTFTLSNSGTLEGVPIVYMADSANGKFIPNSDYSLNVLTGLVTLSGGSIGLSSVDVIFKYTPPSSAGNPRTKTLTVAQMTADADVNGEITLNRTDIFDIDYVIKFIKDPLGVTTGSIDVTDSVVLDNGQTPYFYDKGKISGLTSGETYEVKFLYFKHGPGDYFAVDSYLTADNKTAINPSTGKAYGEFYGYIPEYSGENGVTYNLADVIDFRRKTDDLANVETIHPISLFTTSYEYYLPRTDKIYVDQYAAFGVIKGVASETPDAPADRAGTMTLGEISIPPYTAFADEVDITPSENKRYTMSDIGEIEKRLEKVEYYSAMNLLEQSAKEMRFTDAQGFDKFKNGILVDNFTGHDIGDAGNINYNCAVDPDEEELRCLFEIKNIDMKVNDLNTIGMDLTGENIVTVKTDATPDFIVQPYASEKMNVNPYNVFVWEGNIRLVPNNDNWVDTNQLPDVTVHQNAANAAWLAARDAAKSFGTQWGWWRTNWTSVQRGWVIGRQRVSTGRWQWDRNRWKRGQASGWGISRVVVDRVRTLDTVSQHQTRQGWRFAVRPQTTRRSLGSSVVRTDIIPWIRSRDVVFHAHRMRPGITVNAYFDGVNVNAHIKGDMNRTTDSRGYLTGTFTIPAGKFRTGTRIFRLADDQVSEESITTSAEATYTAQGLRQHQRRTILSLTRPELVRESVTQSRIARSTVVGSHTQVRRETISRWADPLAQSFLIDSEGGVFIDSIDLYFSSKPASGNVPVSIRIVENDNGYPSQSILPYSEVSLYPQTVGSGEVVTTDNAYAPVNPTKFKFSDPVYLQDSVEYSFVVLSNSNEYEVFVAKIGARDLNSNKVIDKQPYNGVMFKSQNASTWTPDQERDIMFTMRRRQFSTALAQYELDSEVVAQQDVTSVTFNIEQLDFEGTVIDWQYQFGADTPVPFMNRDIIELANIKSTNNAGDITVQGKLETTKDNLSPVISKDAFSAIVTNNLVDNTNKIISPYDNVAYGDAGAYITRTTKLINNSDDIKVVLDIKKDSDNEILVYFQTGVYEARYCVGKVNADDLTIAGQTVYLYEDLDTGLLKRTGEAYVSRLDDTNGYVYLKSISDAAAFKPTNVVGSGTMFISPDATLADDDANGVTSYNTSPSASYSVGDLVWYNTDLYQCTTTYTENATPNLNLPDEENSAFWVLIPHIILTGDLASGPEQQWRLMVPETDIPSTAGDFTEFTFKPEEDIVDEFSSFSIKIQMLTNNNANVPKCKNLRAFALY